MLAGGLASYGAGVSGGEGREGVQSCHRGRSWRLLGLPASLLTIRGLANMLVIIYCGVPCWIVELAFCRVWRGRLDSKED